MSKIKPVFIFSLPRSGSTLLQRILGCHTEIDTCAEPWVLLPPAFGTRGNLYAEYGHETARKGLEDFIAKLGEGDQAYADALYAYGSTLYERAAEDSATYFVDKTPRYHLIADQIIDAFPNAKFIFLWRNPLSIAASISNTWCNGHWHFGHYKIDLFKGIKNLTKIAQKYGPQKTYEVKYEKILKEKNNEIRQILDYIGTNEYLKVGKNNLGKEVEGRLGDPTGIEEYSQISKEPIEKWKNSVVNSIRKKWCLRYIKWIGKERLDYMGYEIKNMEKEIRSIEVGYSNTVKDMFYSFVEKFRPWVHPSIQKKYFEKYKNGECLYEVY